MRLIRIPNSPHVTGDGTGLPIRSSCYQGPYLRSFVTTVCEFPKHTKHGGSRTGKSGHLPHSLQFQLSQQVLDENKLLQIPAAALRSPTMSSASSSMFMTGREPTMAPNLPTSSAVRDVTSALEAVSYTHL